MSHGMTAPENDINEMLENWRRGFYARRRFSIYGVHIMESNNKKRLTFV